MVSNTEPNERKDEVMMEEKIKIKKKKKDKKDKKKSTKRKQEHDTTPTNNSNTPTTLTTTSHEDNESHEKQKKKKRKKNQEDAKDALSKEEKMTKKEKKRLKKEKKEKKKKKEDANNDTAITAITTITTASTTKAALNPHDITAAPNEDDLQIVGGRIVSYSASAINETHLNSTNVNTDANTNANIKPKDDAHETTTTTTIQTAGTTDTNNTQSIQEETNEEGCTLLLFYQYIDPMLNDTQSQQLFHHVQSSATQYTIHGRSRVANEGLNCTLTGTYQNIRLWCKALRSYSNYQYFHETEFKLTDHLPIGQSFKKLHVFKVDEIVNYGLAGERAPNMNMTGVHLEPKEYHQKMTQNETVIIDVRNHYEAAIGKFNPPVNGATYIDPMMRKSTEFPLWLDKPETKEMLKGKQVLMYCTGGVRCERASALLRTKIETEEDTKQLGIKGVFQLQGGIDKYFRDFPEGGWWRGKNYVFDKRFSHAPPVAENLDRKRKSQNDIMTTNDNTTSGTGTDTTTNTSIPDDTNQVLGNCVACHKPWDKYRGKRRCPTCGVPLLICKSCDAKVKKNDKSIRCDLCITEGITSKKQLREKENKEMAEYEKKLREQYGFKEVKKKKHTPTNNNPSTSSPTTSTFQKPKLKVKNAKNPENVTRLFVKNLNVKEIDQPQLCELVEGITHIEWIMDKQTKKWYGSVFVEVSTTEFASRAVGSLHKQKVYGRVIQCAFSKPDSKSIWPHPSTKI